MILLFITCDIVAFNTTNKDTLSSGSKSESAYNTPSTTCMFLIKLFDIIAMICFLLKVLLIMTLDVGLIIFSRHYPLSN